MDSSFFSRILFLMDDVLWVSLFCSIFILGSTGEKIVLILPDTQESKGVNINIDTLNVHHYEKWIEVYESKGIICAQDVITQNILETGWFTSKIYLINHNRFGMKRNNRQFNINPRSGNCPSKCKDCEHACYETVEDSIEDFAEWQKQRLHEYCKHFKKGIPKNSEEYYHFLSHLVIATKSGVFVTKYAEDPAYISKLRYLRKKLFN